MEEPADKKKRQRAFLDALQTLPHFTIYYGHFLSDIVICSQCGHIHHTHHEKMTDAFRNCFDVALLVSADSDLVAPVRAVRQLFAQKRVVIAFPPARYSTALARVGSKPLHITRTILAKSVFPDEIIKPNGYVIRKPAEWR